MFVLGGNGSMLAVVNSLRPSSDAPSPNSEEPATSGSGSGSQESPASQAVITARLIPLAWTPLGIAVGENWQDVTLPLSGLFDWIDRTFPPEDERAFIAPIRDLELLARIGWDAAPPDRVDERSVLNVEDLPEEVTDGLARPPVPLVQCAVCRRLCVAGHFVWKEKQLCAWDYHAQVFGRRGPWHEGVYAERHFETLPSCSYVAAPLLAELNVDVVLDVGVVDEPLARAVVNRLLEGDAHHPHMAVRTEGGFTVLREA